MTVCVMIVMLRRLAAPRSIMFIEFMRENHYLVTHSRFYRTQVRVCYPTAGRIKKKILVAVRSGTRVETRDAGFLGRPRCLSRARFYW